MAEPGLPHARQHAAVLLVALDGNLADRLQRIEREAGVREQL